MAADRLPAQNIRMHPLPVISLRADLNLLAAQRLGSEYDQRAGARTYVDHDALLEVSLVMQLVHDNVPFTWPASGQIVLRGLERPSV